MGIQQIMDHIFINIFEEINGKYHYECHRMEGFIFIDAADKSVGAKYIDDSTVKIVAEYWNKPRFEKIVAISEAPSLILNLLAQDILDS